MWHKDRSGGVVVVIVLPLLGLLIGFSAALAAHEQLQRGLKPWRGPYLLGVCLFCFFVIAPLAAYLYIFYPVWTWLYLVDPGDLKWWHGAPVILGAPVLAALGMLAGGGLGYKGKTGLSWVASLVCLAGLVTACVLTSGRLSHLSQGLDWAEAPSVLSSNLTAVFAFVLPMVLGGWAFLLLLYRVEGLKLQRASSAAGAVNDLSLPGPQPLPVSGPQPMPLSSADSMNKLSLPELEAQSGSDSSESDEGDGPDQPDEKQDSLSYQSPALSSANSEPDDDSGSSASAEAKSDESPKADP